MVVVLLKVCFFLVLSLIPCQGIVRKDIFIKRSGLLPIESADVGFSIFITILNIGETPVHVVSKMVECCESLTDDETDCSFMHLMGGNMGFVPSNATRNVTLIFPNMYPYNRRGDCLIAIWYRNRYNITSEVRVSVAFNTYKKSTMESRKERLSLMRTCSGADLDPLDKCRPVDCHQKYNGEKPYFSRLRKKCIASPACYADPNKIMPDIAYLPVSNTCRDLENPITEEDVRYLSKVGVKSDPNFIQDPHFVSWAELNMNLRCHHGRMSNKTGLCRCDEGWTSSFLSDNLMISSTLLYHMCTIKKSYIKLFNFGYFVNRFFEHGSKILLIAIGLNLVALLLMCICFPSFDASCAINSCTDDEDSEMRGKNSQKYTDSDYCSCITDSEASDNTVDTCYILLDEVGRDLYSRGVSPTDYKEVIEAIICEFSCIPEHNGIFGKTAIYNISTSSSCSDFVVESGKSSALEGNIIDTDIFASSGESDWDPGDIANTDLTFNEQRRILNEYINDNKNYITSPIASTSGLRPPLIDGSSSLFEIQRFQPYSDNTITASERYNQLSRELATILNSTRTPTSQNNHQLLFRK